jgi:hypothetical protein
LTGVVTEAATPTVFGRQVDTPSLRVRLDDGIESAENHARFVLRTRTSPTAHRFASATAADNIRDSLTLKAVRVELERAAILGDCSDYLIGRSLRKIS